MIPLAGGLQAKSMTSYRAEPSKMAGMRYHGNVMTTTRWRLYIKIPIITRSVYTSNSKSTVWVCYRCILHLQQYSHRPNLFSYFNSVSFHFSPTRFQPTFPTILTQLPECLNCLGQAVSPGGRHFSGGLICGVHVCMYVRMCVFEYPVESANI